MEKEVVVREDKNKEGDKKKKEQEEKLKEKIALCDLYELTTLNNIGDSHVIKLLEHGIRSLRALAMYPRTRLEDINGLGQKTIDKVLKYAQKKVDEDFESAEEIMEYIQTLPICSTGSENLNGLLGGGIQMGRYYEFFGVSKSGKSGLMHQISMYATQPIEKGGFNGSVAYVDTEQSSSVERLKQMCDEHDDIDWNFVKKHVYFKKARNSDEQLRIITSVIPKWIEERNVKLVIIDSLAGQLRSDYIGRRVKFQRQQQFNIHIHDLMRLIDIYKDVAVIVTNQVSSKPNGDKTEIVHVGGNIVAHSSINRIRFEILHNGEVKKTKAIIEQMTYHSNGLNTEFYITSKGITDKL